jgi:hypothetical protein
MGVSDTQTEGLWLWDGLIPATYTNWDTGFPLSRVVGEDYAYFSRATNRWFSSYDTLPVSSVVCEYGKLYNTHTHARTYTYTHTHIHTHTYTHTRAHTHTHTHTHIHAHTHSHTQSVSCIIIQVSICQYCMWPQVYVPANWLLIGSFVLFTHLPT